MTARLDQRIAAVKAENRAALITFTMAFDPDRDTSLAILQSLPQAGADIIEVGIPFSDPMADGPIIQEAGLRALKSGATVKGVLDIVKDFRKHNADTPIILMGYYNPVFHYGVEAFVKDAVATGADGMIIVDLPAEEMAEVQPAATAHNFPLIRLIAPTTPDERLPHVLNGARGFAYYIAVAGITGVHSADLATLETRITHLKQKTPLPLAVGFGVKTPAQAASIAQFADGVVVGSALVDVIAKNKGNTNLAQMAAAFVTQLADALKADVEFPA